jgi:formylglycine-generating enzyme required for sulfatase activity
MNKYAILIGNGSFPDEPTLNNLRCPLLDVVGLEKVLKTEARGNFNEVGVLKDYRYHDIAYSLNKVLHQANRDDLVLVYYSGHGKPSKSGQLYLPSFNTEVSLLSSTALGLNKVYEFINDSTCQKIILILDCCYSGVAGRGFKGDLDSKLKQMNAESRGTYLITASTAIQVAVENPEDEYSLFTKHLIGGLETGAADKEGDGIITIDQLYQYVHDQVLAENKNQQPTKTSQGERGGLVIAKSGYDLREEVISKIRPRLLELSQQEDAFIGVLSDTVAWINLLESQLSSLQKQKYALLKKLLDHSLTPMSFIIAWQGLNQASPLVADDIKIIEKVDLSDQESVNKIEDKPVEKKQIANDEVKPRPAEINEKNKQKKSFLHKKYFSPLLIFIIIGGIALYINSADDLVPPPNKAPAMAKTAEPEEYAQTAIEKNTANITAKNPSDSFEPEMMTIPAGNFMMGSSDTNKLADDDEKSQHQVTIAKAFAIGKYEVTVGEFRQFVNDISYQTEAEKQGGCYIYKNEKWMIIKGYSWEKLGFKQTEQHPVACVSWNDAQAYVEWLSEKTGKAYRLPSEGEWEYAMRAGTTTDYYWGNTIDCAKANYGGGNCNLGKTTTVGAYPANAWGLHDMAGNVWEWTMDCWHENYKSAPVDGIAWLAQQKGDCDRRGVRGGSWFSNPRNLRSAYRGRSDTIVAVDYLGFRVARVL